MRWDYRVVRTDDGDEKFYEVREAYYDGDDKVTSVTARSIGLASETAQGLALALPAYLKALTLPVLDDDTLAEVEPPISAQALSAAR